MIWLGCVALLCHYLMCTLYSTYKYLHLLHTLLLYEKKVDIGYNGLPIVGVSERVNEKYQ